jgi:transposase-like protein
VIGEGMDGLSEAVAILINEAMRLERERHIGAGSYERSAERRDYANGFKPKNLKTRIGELNLRVPKVRQGDFYPSTLERGLRSERALKLALAEMYVHGVSTRRMAAITEQMCGFEVSSTQVSRAAAELDAVLAEWRARPLGRFPYVFLDARYEKVRHGGTVVDSAVLWAIGVGEDGKRDVLGVSVSRSEAEVHWRAFLESLGVRGLHGVQLIVADDHSGLRAARQAVFPGVPWQRCQFHLQRNAQKHAPRKTMLPEIHDDLRAVFNAPNRAEADRQLKLAIAKYETTAPQLATWMEEAVPEGLTVFNFPRSHQRRLRTINAVERCNHELRRRTRVAGVFPHDDSCLRLVSAILMEIAEDWQVGKIYLNLDHQT